ncbi:vacuolar ATPase proteolipid subunit c [Penicillium angulare]|uniref:vacuolar ATPase proteolipid subunit c n=1 Tax=Penicillium angulare TaxID=116970 RepID=UPI00254013B5|nr:vacuolar ATPase proteolipid subunit c [Penicillium angulare]KAJ5280133.1 vacuolar ATPase proteolipid subunit c [Penicillium angulare]
MAASEFAPKFAPFLSFCIKTNKLLMKLGRNCFCSEFQIDLQDPEQAPSLTPPSPKMIFGCAGAAYGTAKAGVGIAGSLIPVVMSGIIAVYGLVIAVLIAQALRPGEGNEMFGSLYESIMHLAAGLSVGLTGLAAGYTIGTVGDAGVRAYMQQSRVYVGMILILIFGEVLGLYGLIVGLILNSRS